MRTLYLHDSPAAAATRAAHPVTLPGVVGAPRLAARVRLARGTVPPSVGPSQETLAALADVRAILHTTPDVREAMAYVRSALACGAVERALAGAHSVVAP
jgi:hypothetical protein